MAFDKRGVTRRQALKTLGVAGAASALGCLAKEETEKLAWSPPRSFGSFRNELEQSIFATPIVDTHEHLPDEQARLAGQSVPCDDWAVLLSHYLDSDLRSAGMPKNKREKLVSPDVEPMNKWELLQPFWPFVRNSGYGRAVRLSMRELYGIDDLDERSIVPLQQGYEALRRPGMYRKVLVDAANIESCQVNSLTRAFHESSQPTLLMQDLSIVGMHFEPDIDGMAEPTGIRVKNLAGWYAVIRWWFETYAPYAVAVKSQAAYFRGLSYARVDAGQAAPIFKRWLRRQPLSPEEKKLLEDHLFWFCIEQATEHDLPVKLHTGILYDHGKQPWENVASHALQAAELCRQSPDTRFIFLHICYPYWQDLIAIAKQYANAYVDMSWAWIIDPVSCKKFLKSYLVAAPSKKLLPFGGDYVPVECVLGHSILARRGIARALAELVDEGWLEARDALELVEPILRGNAHRVFRLDKKANRLAKAPWI